MLSTGCAWSRLVSQLMLRLVLQLVALWSQLFRNCRRRIALEAAYALAASKQNFCTEKCTEKTAPEKEKHDEFFLIYFRRCRIM
jgi:hypothetical protein